MISIQGGPSQLFLKVTMKQLTLTSGPSQTLEKNHLPPKRPISAGCQASAVLSGKWGEARSPVTYNLCHRPKKSSTFRLERPDMKKQNQGLMALGRSEVAPMRWTQLLWALCLLIWWNMVNTKLLEVLPKQVSTNSSSQRMCRAFQTVPCQDRQQAVKLDLLYTLIEKQSSVWLKLQNKVKEWVSTGIPNPLPSHSFEDSFLCLKDKSVSGLPGS